MTNAQSHDDSADSIDTPPELSGAEIPKPPIDPTTSAEGKTSVLPEADSSRSLVGLDAYTKHLHTYIREYIAAADKKATLVFTIAAAFLAYLYEKGVMDGWPDEVKLWRLDDVVAFISLFGLSISCLLAVLVVFPRLAGSRRGFVYWGAVSEFTSPNEFVSEALKVDDSRLTRELLAHSFELARICRQKYGFLNWAIRVGAVGALASVLLITWLGP